MSYTEQESTVSATVHQLCHSISTFLTAVMPERITILHISDVQFGKHHQFGSIGLGTQDADFDSLLRRLQLDLDVISNPNALRIDLVCITGDLAEWATPKEYSDVLSFLDALTNFLSLDKERVVLIPGNHDINRNASQAYVLNCSANDEPALRPYTPKWNNFKRMYDAFYEGTGRVFDLDSPCDIFDYDDLGVAIAALNSTMRESHIETDHYGEIGEAQCRWFEPRLKELKRRGYLVIGNVHHNVDRGAVADDENLRDADLLTRTVGECLDIILHGHTHEARTNWRGPNQVTVSTGSAALSNEARPADVPNQYQ